MAERKGVISSIRARNRELRRVARETAPSSGRAAGRAARLAAIKNQGRPSDKDIERIKRMSPEAIARELNRDRIRSQSRDVSRKRTALSVAKGKIRQGAKKVRKKLRGFIPGRTKF
jgi:hypothetical protein